MRPSVRLVLVASLALALGRAAPAAAAPDVTPLESSPGLSSGFGEFRDAHFHAGLDYSTDEQEGRPVRAVNDGWVERVRASGVGYGRAVYLRLDDGRTVVYGHLSRFAPKLDAFVGAHQESAGVYEQDLVPLPNLIRFARGEIVAWSGQSGAGPPHLHFEVRRGDENFNPLLHGFAMPDHVAPTLATAWLTPHGPHARVGGGIDEVRVALRAGAAVTAPPVVGDFDLAVDTWDRADGKPNKLATYRLEARVDGAKEPTFEAVVDSFSWDTTVEVERVYDFAATLRGDETRRTLAKLPSFKESVVRRGPAVWSLPPGTHRIELAAVDEAGNRAVATLVVPVPAPGVAATPAGNGRRNGARLARALPAEGEIRGTSFCSPAASPLPRGVAIADSVRLGGQLVRICRVTGSNELMFGARSGRRPDSTQVVLDVSTATGGGFFLLDDLDSTLRVFPLRRSPLIEFPPHSAYEECAARLTLVAPPEPTAELVPGEAAYRLEPVHLALRRPYRVRIYNPRLGVRGLEARRNRVGLFLRHNTGWSFLAAMDSAQGFDATTRRFGTFAVFADTTAPRIVAVPETRWRHASGVGAAADSSRAPRLSFIISDRGAGLAPADQSIFVDGRRVPAEYDPEASRLNWYPRAWPRAGRHEVRIEAVDRLGNRSVRVVALAVD